MNGVVESKMPQHIMTTYMIFIIGLSLDRPRGLCPTRKTLKFLSTGL